MREDIPVSDNVFPPVLQLRLIYIYIFDLDFRVQCDIS